MVVIVRFATQQAMPSPDGHALGSNAQLRAELRRCQQSSFTQAIVTWLQSVPEPNPSDQMTGELQLGSGVVAATVQLSRDGGFGVMIQELVDSAHQEKLMLHAQTKEEVIYPAAILVGEYPKLKLHQ